MKTTCKKILCLSFYMLSVLGAIFSKEKEGVAFNSDSSNSSNKIMALCSPPSSKIELDINNVRAMMLNAGDMWWDLTDPRYEIPKVDDPDIPKKHSIFAGALWIGGVDPGGQLYVTSQTYRQGGDVAFWAGPLNSVASITSDECLAWDRHFKVNASTIDDFKANYPSYKDESDIDDEIRLWPGKNNTYLLQDDLNFGATLNQDLAPFIDVDSNGNYDPLKGDYPDIQGDQAIWWVINDAGAIKAPLTPAIGLEMHIMAFAFATNDAINDMTFYENILINKGNITLNDTYFGQWVDPDLGQFNDDYVGCDVGRGMGICYNGDEFDEGVNGYGLNPPSIAVDFFEGPMADPGDGIDNDRDGTIDEDGEKIIMSNFVYYNNDFTFNGNPESAPHIYNYLRSIWKDGTKVTYDGADGTDQSFPPCKFMFPDDTDPFGWGVGGNFDNPVSMPVWTEGTAQNAPADRRFLLSAGPFTLKPGAVNNLTIAVIWARATRGGSTGSLGLLAVFDDQAQELFDNNFELLNGPNAPVISIVELDQQLILTIVSDTFPLGGETQTTENYKEFDNSLKQKGAVNPFYTFQGYLIYQLKATPSFSFENIAPNTDNM